ncbi:hypothetical protein N658DRAFT_491275 [Parathielavia hyrcaniae]|uniref:Uncharacterized protein n=1 Tax=Parathielavia hyrcaniae TaxID=113614 RepID=A0AAN6QBR7_9PEZI|nr:hypothetical protein N658DRAFT_491275 [Parathielavia hyrcaniae]
MPTAQGTLVRNSDNRFTAEFATDDGLQTTFSATVSPAIHPFTTNSVTLTYDDAEQLTSTRSYTGRIGIDKFVLAFANGPIISGGLNVPGVYPAETVAGTGAWEQN